MHQTIASIKLAFDFYSTKCRSHHFGLRNNLRVYMLDKNFLKNEIRSDNKKNAFFFFPPFQYVVKK